MKNRVVLNRVLMPDRQSRVSAMGKLTIDLALRLGGLFVAIVGVAVVFDIFNGNFLNTDVIVSILRAMSSVAIMGLGLTLVIVTGEIDLSVGSMYGLAANMLAVVWIIGGVPIYLAMLLTLGAAAIVGLCNGLMAAYLRIPSFIVTLGSYNLLYGISLWLSNAATFNPNYPPDGYSVNPRQVRIFTDLTLSLGSHQFSIEVFWMLGLALLIGFVLHYSLFGFRLVAIGGNPVAARLARLPVHRYRIIAFVLCSMLSGIAGVLDFSFIQTSQPDLGLSQTFPVFAAVVIGGTSLSGGKGTVVGTLGGALLLAELQIGLALLSPGPYAQQIFLGAVTIGAVALDIVLTRFRARAAT
jgi:ribose/xylose/arabinose/galactoside ABC-type transport system permease subunit